MGERASGGYDRFSLLWKCAECGRVMTTRQAQRSMEKGCLAGCSGIDVEPLDGPNPGRD
jgi:hypothetical protein